MIDWQVFCNRLSFVIHEQQAVAVLVNLHIIASAYPGAMLRFSLLVRIETARTQRLAESCKISRQAHHNRFANLPVRVRDGSRLLAISLYKPLDPRDGLVDLDVHASAMNAGGIPLHIPHPASSFP